MSWIQTFTGKKFPLGNPDPALIDIEDTVALSAPSFLFQVMCVILSYGQQFCLPSKGAHK